MDAGPANLPADIRAGSMIQGGRQQGRGRGTAEARVASLQIRRAEDGPQLRRHFGPEIRAAAPAEGALRARYNTRKDLLETWRRGAAVW